MNLNETSSHIFYSYTTYCMTALHTHIQGIVFVIYPKSIHRTKINYLYKLHMQMFINFWFTSFHFILFWNMQMHWYEIMLRETHTPSFARSLYTYNISLWYPFSQTNITYSLMPFLLYIIWIVLCIYISIYAMRYKSSIIHISG